jgi:hypothetical protein
MNTKTIYFALLISTLIIACKKENTTNSTPDEVTALEKIHFSGKINNEYFNYIHDVDIPNGVSEGRDSYKTINNIEDSTFNFFYGANVQNEKYWAKRSKITVIKGSILLHGSPSRATETQFNNFFKVGTYPIATDTSNGFTIAYSDSTRKEWSTLWGDNQNHTVSIDEIITVIPLTTTFAIKVRFKFNCTVYDMMGNSLFIEDATFIGAIENLGA